MRFFLIAKTIQKFKDSEKLWMKETDHGKYPSNKSEVYANNGNKFQTYNKMITRKWKQKNLN